MVVVHMVWIKTKTDLPDKINAIVEGVAELKAIPGVVSAEAALVIRLENKESLNVYQDHEIHIAFKSKYLAGVAESVIAFDFEA